jgi:hypothetical protein
MQSSLFIDPNTLNVGIGTTRPKTKLHVEGTITASNMSILGDFVTLNTITSNTEQMVISNAGTGPALKVTQTGAHPIADFYDDGDVLAMRIADGGNVGIGTANPMAKLHIIGSTLATGNTTSGIQFLGPNNDTVTNPSYSWTGNTNTGIYRPSTNEIGIVTNGAERIRVDASGNVGINTTSTHEKLCISSGGINDYHGIRFYETSPAYGGFLKYHNGEDRLTIGTTNASVDINAINISRSSGYVGIGTNIPLARLHVAGTFHASGSVINCATVQYTAQTTYTVPTSVNATEISVLNIAITPKFVNSKMILQWMVCGEGDNNGVFVVYRDSVAIGYNTIEGNTQYSGVQSMAYDTQNANTPSNHYICWVDTPNTTSSINYSIRMRSTSGVAFTFYLNRCLDADSPSIIYREYMCSNGIAWELAV